MSSIKLTIECETLDDFITLVAVIKGEVPQSKAMQELTSKLDESTAALNEAISKSTEGE